MTYESVAFLWRLVTQLDGVLTYHRLPLPLRAVALLCGAPRPFHRQELADLSLDPPELERNGIIAALAPSSWYQFKTLQWGEREDATLLGRLLKASRGANVRQVKAIIAFQRDRRRLGLDAGTNTQNSTN